MATNSVSDLIAAQLSNAAYTPLATYQAGGSLPTSAPVPQGGIPAPQFSNYGTNPDGTPDLNNQFVTFINTTGPTPQVMIVFKGTDNIPNGVSDIANSGGQAWDSIKSNAQAALASINEAIKNDPSLAGAQIMTDGHSLGGGMAQYFALANNLNGFGQNSLPISLTALNEPMPNGPTTLAGNVSAWNASGNTFNEVNTAGDPATNYYSTLQGQIYLNTSTTTLANPWAAGEAAGGLLSLVAPPLGAALLFFIDFDSN